MFVGELSEGRVAVCDFMCFFRYCFDLVAYEQWVHVKVTFVC